MMQAMWNPFRTWRTLMAIPEKLDAINANLADLNANVALVVAALQAAPNSAALEASLDGVATGIASASASLKNALPQ
jgi:hypothetical protein